MQVCVTRERPSERTHLCLGALHVQGGHLTGPRFRKLRVPFQRRWARKMLVLRAAARPRRLLVALPSVAKRAASCAPPPTGRNTPCPSSAGLRRRGWYGGGSEQAVVHAVSGFRGAAHASTRDAARWTRDCAGLSLSIAASRLVAARGLRGRFGVVPTLICQPRARGSATSGKPRHGRGL